MANNNHSANIGFEKQIARLMGELGEMFAKSVELTGEIKKRLGAIEFEM
jgi:hypothetical protein